MGPPMGRPPMRQMGQRMMRRMRSETKKGYAIYMIILLLIIGGVVGFGFYTEWTFKIPKKGGSDKKDDDKTQTDKTQTDKTQTDKTQTDKTQTDTTQTDTEIIKNGWDILLDDGEDNIEYYFLIGGKSLDVER